MAARRPNKPVYIYDIPLKISNEIHKAMDASGSWRKLAEEYGFTVQWMILTEQRIGHGSNSPTKDLLGEMGHKNLTINQFYKTLYKLGMFREMERIKEYVSRDLRHLCEGSDISGSIMWSADLQVSLQQGSWEKTQEMPTQEIKDAGSFPSGLGGPNEFPYEAIKTATSNFCEQLLLGVGGFSRVYKAWMDGSYFAIKVIVPKNPELMSQDSLRQHHRNEIEKLTKIRHKNVINLSGFSSNGPQFCLVMEFMENGSLESCLTESSRKPLSWFTRYAILKDAVCGLEYLHSQSVNCIHGDIKSANILLDNNFVAKLADFGLAKQATTTHVMTRTAAGQTQVTRHDINGNEKRFGTLAYLPADFTTNGATFSRFTDVYSMGVVFCESLTGLKAYSKMEDQEKKFLKDRVKVILRERCPGGQGRGQDLADLADKRAEGWPGNLWSRLMDLSLQCLQEKRQKRPDSKTLHEELTKLYKEAQELKGEGKAKKEDRGEKEGSAYSQSLVWQTNEVYASGKPVMNIISDEEADFQNKVKVVGTPSMVANRGSSHSKNLQFDETAATGDLYGPGDKQPECESRWLNYEVEKVANDKDQTQVFQKMSNLNDEGEDPKYLKYDEKKLGCTSSLESVANTQKQEELFNGLPPGQLASKSYEATSFPSNSDNGQEMQNMFLSEIPESIRMQIYYDMQRQIKKNQLQMQSDPGGVQGGAQQVTPASPLSCPTQEVANPSRNPVQNSDKTNSIDCEYQTAENPHSSEYSSAAEFKTGVRRSGGPNYEPSGEREKNHLEQQKDRLEQRKDHLDEMLQGDAEEIKAMRSKAQQSNLNFNADSLGVDDLDTNDISGILSEMNIQNNDI